MVEIIEVKCKNERISRYDPQGLDLNKGDKCIVEGEGAIQEIGEVWSEIKMIPHREIKQALRKVLRKFSKEDMETLKANKERESQAHIFCLQKIKELNLDMKLVKVEYNFDASFAIFYFSSEHRVDFRELVKELAQELKIRVEMRQIGVRDEAKILGGFGHCGQPLCCMRFLKEFKPVSMHMVKTQNLDSNPAKLSGICGRLMCCLKYEYDFYKQMSKKLPRPGSRIKVKDEIGLVSEVNLLREVVKVKFPDGRETEVQF